jgi:hypothetical protein
MSNAETQMLIDAAATAFQAMQENNASFVEAIGGLLALSQNQVGDIFTPNPFHENIDLQLENLANEFNIPDLVDMLPEDDGGDEPMDTRPDFEDLPDLLPPLAPIGDGLPPLAYGLPPLADDDGLDFERLQQELEDVYSDEEDLNHASSPEAQNIHPNENEDELYWNDIALEFQEYAGNQGLYENEANLNNETVHAVWVQYLNEHWDPDWHERIEQLGEHCAWFGVFPMETN